MPVHSSVQFIIYMYVVPFSGHVVQLLRCMSHIHSAYDDPIDLCEYLLTLCMQWTGDGCGPVTRGERV